MKLLAWCLVQSTAVKPKIKWFPFNLKSCNNLLSFERLAFAHSEKIWNRITHSPHVWEIYEKERKVSAFQWSQFWTRKTLNFTSNGRIICLQVVQSRVAELKNDSHLHKIVIFWTQPNDLFTVWLFFIAELIVQPNNQELQFPIGKVGKRLSEFLLVIVIVGISCLLNEIKT